MTNLESTPDSHGAAFFDTAPRAVRTTLILAGVAVLPVLLLAVDTPLVSFLVRDRG